MKKLLLLLLSVIYFAEKGNAQTNYGTTGLMNMPTADMQRDKTFMLGGNWLNSHATVPRWWYDTWNYYINITLFPWLEVGYLCMGHKASPPTMVIDQVIGSRQLTASLSIRTVPSISGCGSGKRGGGKRGHHRS